MADTAAGDVARLLAGCDRRTATGRRDYAILTVMVRLGLRAGKVAALTLDDIDWRAGELVVVGKGDRELVGQGDRCCSLQAAKGEAARRRQRRPQLCGK